MSEFHRNKTKQEGRQYICKVCTCLEQREKYSYEHNRRANLKAHYGITPETYTDLLIRQGGGCAVCGSRKGNARTACLHVDHDHITGFVRGLLCSRCNTAFGLLDDNPERIQKLLDYALARAATEGEDTPDAT